MFKKSVLLLAVFSCIFIISCEKDEGSPTTPSSTNHNPNAPNTPTPADGATNVATPVTLKWNCSDPDTGDTLKYDIFAGNTNPPSEKKGSNLVNKAFDLGIPAAGSMVYWKVVAKDNHGATTVGPVWSFRVKE